MKRAAFPLLGIIFSTLIFLPIVRAEDTPQQGVTMTVYAGSPLGLVPWETTPDLPVCYSGVVPNIDFGWGGAPAADGHRGLVLATYEVHRGPQEEGRHRFELQRLRQRGHPGLTAPSHSSQAKKRMQPPRTSRP